MTFKRNCQNLKLCWMLIMSTVGRMTGRGIWQDMCTYVDIGYLTTSYYAIPSSNIEEGWKKWFAESSRQIREVPSQPGCTIWPEIRGKKYLQNAQTDKVYVRLAIQGWVTLGLPISLTMKIQYLFMFCYLYFVLFDDLEKYWNFDQPCFCTSKTQDKNVL